MQNEIGLHLRSVLNTTKNIRQNMFDDVTMTSLGLMVITICTQIHCTSMNSKKVKKGGGQNLPTPGCDTSIGDLH